MNFIFAVLMSLSAQAQTADQLVTVMNCQRAQPIADLGLEVTVQQGGFAGVTEVKVEQFFLAHNSTDTYVVREIKPANVGAPVVYEGRGIRLTTNFTTAPLKDGGHEGTLELQGQGTVEVSCKLK